jgi:2-methylcitrate dehydratase PrpD
MQQRAGRFIHGLRFDDLPREVVERAQSLMLDLLGVAAAGSGTALARIACDHAFDFFGAGRNAVHMLFDGRSASPLGAALAGGMTIDSFDGHDGHVLTKGHVGVAILPALLAMAELDPSMDGREAIASLVLGYEIGTRAGIALHASSSEYHTSGAWNALAAAALCARSLKLDEPTTRHALGIAEYHGPRSEMMRCIDFPTMLKDGSGWGSMAGVSAALFAQRGFTGAPALTVEAHDPALWEDLGERWMILEQYVKPYPVCRWAHPSIAAALQLRAEHDLSAETIESVIIETFHQATRLCSTFPANTEEAQYGVLFPVAAALADGRVDARTIQSEGLSDARLRALLPRMRTVESAEFSAAFPAERWARIVVTTRDGAQLDSGPVTASGGPDKPMSQDALLWKFRSLTSARFGEGLARQIENDVLSLHESASALQSLKEHVLTAPIEQSSRDEAMTSVL